VRKNIPLIEGKGIGIDEKKEKNPFSQNTRRERHSCQQNNLRGGQGKLQEGAFEGRPQGKAFVEWTANRWAGRGSSLWWGRETDIITKHESTTDAGEKGANSSA